VASRLGRAFSSEETKRTYVRGLFATIAGRYDLITRLLSFGRDRVWKARLIEMAGAGRGTAALDLACGTGDIAFGIAERGADVVGLDVTLGMLQLARGKAGRPPVQFVAGDMMALPFPDASFDVVSTGYGIRNVPRIDPVLAEIHRVLRPGGVLLSLDFDRPERTWMRRVYLTYLTIVGSVLGWLLHRDPDTYRYIPESIRRYPGSRGVARLMQEYGFADCGVVPLLGGFMAINVGRRAAT
jgi:demethylmenaquinone methyltransferase/2-methoxy-6-polyprenyl-1,4-benzoquinol methylase